MTVFLIYLFLICFPAFICAYRHGTSSIVRKSNRPVTLLLPMFALAFIMGLRHSSVGVDTQRYITTLTNYSHMGLKTLFSQGYAYGFYLFNKIVSYLCGGSYTVYFSIIAVFVCISFYFFFRRHSVDYCLSQVLLIALGFSFFFMTGLKQTLAICILLYAYTALRDRKIVLFVLLTVLAASFHPSALIFLLILPVQIGVLRRIMIVLAPFVIVLANIYQEQIFRLFGNLLPEDLYSTYGTTYTSQINMTGLLIQIAIFAMSLVLLWTHLKEDDEASHLLAIYVIGMFFQAMTGILGEFARVSMYFSLFGTLLLPKALSKVDKRYYTALSAAVCLVFTAYFIGFSSSESGILPYHFFWELY